MSTRGLGKGFGSLLPDNFDTSIMLDKGERIHKISIQDIKPDLNQPRKTFDSTAIDELAESIKRYGILQPLVVTQSGSGYVVIAGERRYRAAKKIGISHVPALVRTMEDLEKLEVGLIENMQRVDLSPLEQAVSIARLNEQFNMSLHDIAARLGKAHTTIVNMVRLLQLPDFARKALDESKISEGHARSVLALKDNAAAQKYLVERIIKEGWSVRQAEAYVKKTKVSNTSSLNLQKKSSMTNTKYSKDAVLIEKKLSAKTKIIPRKSGIKVELVFDTNKNYTQFLNNLTD